MSSKSSSGHIIITTRMEASLIGINNDYNNIWKILPGTYIFPLRTKNRSCLDSISAFTI